MLVQKGPGSTWNFWGCNDMVVTELWGGHIAAVSLLGFAANEPFKVG